MSEERWFERLGFLSAAQVVLYSALLVVVLATFFLTLARAPERMAEWALGAGALAVAATTLYFVLPRPARIIAMEQPELDLSDLIFFLHTHEEALVPRDFLIQVHAAFANIGNEKGVLSRAEIMSFQDAGGSVVTVPGVPLPLLGAQYVVHKGWDNGNPYFRNEEIQGPYMLDPNAVMTMRFRARRGITWGPATSLEQLEALATALETPIVAARIRFSYRSRARLVEAEKTIPIRVVQQGEYRQAIAEVTSGFTTVPPLPFQRVLE